MKSIILIATLFSLNVMANDLKCEARHEYEEDGRLVVKAWPMVPKAQLNQTVFQYDGDSAYYSINLDKNDGRYLIAINFAPKYQSGSLSSGKLEEGGNNLTLSVVDGYKVHKIFCVRK